MVYVLIFFKAMFIYFLLFFLIRLNSKGIGEKTFYDYTLLIILGTVAADPLGKNDSLLSTIIALLGLWAGHRTAVTAVRVNWLRFLIHGKPGYLIKAGVFNVQEFYSSKLTVPELYSELRLQGYCKLSDIDWAIIEPIGKISLIPKPGTPSRVLCVEPIIIDGVVQQHSLHMAGRDVSWLEDQLRQSGYHAASEILIAEMFQENVVTFYPKIEKLKT